jgi:hypothetical protein
LQARGERRRPCAEGFCIAQIDIRHEAGENAWHQATRTIAAKATGEVSLGYRRDDSTHIVQISGAILDAFNVVA